MINEDSRNILGLGIGKEAEKEMNRKPSFGWMMPAEAGRTFQSCEEEISKEIGFWKIIIIIINGP